jgi:prepilin-type N-terminal cleavage/methylation domain-containing protein
MNSTPIRQRRGFTLSEMLVVLGILVVITAVAQPAIRATLSDNRLRSAGRQVRIELAKARLKAVQSGVAQRFRYQLGKNRFEVVPLSAHEAGTTERGAQGGAFSAGHDDAAASLVETVDDAATNDRCPTVSALPMIAQRVRLTPRRPKWPAKTARVGRHPSCFIPTGGRPTRKSSSRESATRSSRFRCAV